MSKNTQENLPNVANVDNYINDIKNFPKRLLNYVPLLEGILLSSPDGLSISILTSILKEYHDINNLDVQQIINYLVQQWQDESKTLELIEVSSGWRFQTKPILSKYLQQLNHEKPHKYSRATMEILSIIAYKQPVTRGDIESIRGVVVNANSIRILEDRGWIEVIGQREVVGRPNLYGTTPQFLNDMGIRNLGQLPALQQEEISV